MTIYDPISQTLGLDLIEFEFDCSSFEHTKQSIPWNLGKPHMQKENHPLWGKKHTDEAKQKISKARSGSKASDKTKHKMSEMRKGKKPDGLTMKGKKHTDETKQKISESSKGFSENTRKGQKAYMTGKKLPDAWRISQRNAREGKKIYNNGQITKMFKPDEVEPGFVLGKLKKDTNNE